MTTWAMEPPGEDDLKEAVVYDEAAERIGNYRSSASFSARAEFVMKSAWRTAKARQSGQFQQHSALIPPDWTGMPSTGEIEVLALLCDFKGQRAADVFPGMTRERVHANLFGSGTAEAQAYMPRDSLRNYYERASNNRLVVGGETLGWYHFSGAQEDYKGLAAGDDRDQLWAMTKEMLLAYDAIIDFSRFDNDGDGVVDSLNLFWVGETGPWSSFWWGYRWNFGTTGADDFTLDGVRFHDFSWQWVESREDDPSDYDPRVITHEFGHLIGLPDLYDYYPQIGPRGGVGGFDLMDSSRGGNHNAFFRWILGWIEPAIYTVGEDVDLTLKPSGMIGTTGNAAIVFFDQPSNETDAFAELLAIEFRSPVGNDAILAEVEGFGDGGLAVWHVDATLDSDRAAFLYDNSDTPHKLMRLIQADNLEEIEASSGDFDSADFFHTGDELGPGSAARNGTYAKAPSRVVLKNISIGANEATARIESYPGPLLQVSPGYLQLQQPPGVEYPPPTFLFQNSDTTPVAVEFGRGGFLGSNYEENLPSGNAYRGLPLITGSLASGIHREVYRFSSPDGTLPDVFIPVQVHVRVPLVDALGFYSPYLRTGRHEPWVGQNEEVMTGPFAAASGIIPDDRQSYLSTYVVAPSRISFSWKVSSEANHDFLRFQVNGDVVAEISGEVAWNTRTFDVPGDYEWVQVSWSYAKDEEGSSGRDQAWVDDVTVTPSYYSAFQDWTRNYYGFTRSPLDRASDGRTLLEHFGVLGSVDPRFNPVPIDWSEEGQGVIYEGFGSFFTYLFPVSSGNHSVGVTFQGSLDGITWYSIEEDDCGFEKTTKSINGQDVEVMVLPSRSPFPLYRRRFDLRY